MADLCDQLAELIVQDNAVLLIGSELRRALGDVPLTQQIADALASRINYRQPERSLPQVAQDYETYYGRLALVQALKEQVERLAGEPSPVHRLIADAVIPGTKVITTRFDQLLEHTLELHQKPYVRIVRDTDLPFFDEAKVTVIKIQGDITQPDSLVITDDDLDDFVQRLPTISDVIRAFFATKTLIFLGYELRDAHFKRLFREVSRELKGFRRPAYAVTPEPLPEVEQRYWQQHGVALCVRDPAPFLTSLAEAVKQAQHRLPAFPNPLAALSAPPLPDAPYKALARFTLADAPIFFGRKEESQRLANRILARQLTLLYGESGCGKTSLLQAGVAPLLADQRALLALVEPVADRPAEAALAGALLAAGLQAGLEPPPTDTSLADLIRHWQTALDGPIVLAIDQFEQFFLALDPTQQASWLSLLAALAQDRRLFLRLVLVIREDFLGRVQAVDSALPHLWEGRFRLERLGREAAWSAIVEPALAFAVHWQPALVEVLLDALATGNGAIAPPPLQIVCDRLYRAVKEQPLASEITLDHLQGLGGIEGILGDYLDGAVQGLAPAQQPLARQLLGALVSSNRVKQRLSLDDLARVADCPPAEAAVVLDALVAQRLVVRYESGGRAAPPVDYELIHDYLVPRIARWLGPEFWDEQRARELVRQAVPAWQARGHLPAPDTLRLAAAYHGRLRFAPAEAAMLFAGAVAAGQDADAWQSDLTPDTCRRALLTVLDNAAPAPRAHAARRLAEFADRAAVDALVAMALHDRDAAPRQAAAQAIAVLLASGPTDLAQSALAQLASAAVAPPTQPAAVEALAVVRDLQPASAAYLPSALRSAVRRRVWANRWQRHRSQILADTVQAVQWGYLSLALTLGVQVFIATVTLYPALQPLTTASLLVFSLATAGVVGAAAVGVGGLGRAWLRYGGDGGHEARNWAVVSALTALVFAAGWLVLLPAAAGATVVRGTFGLALLASLATAGCALAPLGGRWTWAARLAATALVGAAAFTVAAFIGRTSGGIGLRLPLAPLAGLATGVGFFAGLNPGFWRSRRLNAEGEVEGGKP